MHKSSTNAPDEARRCLDLPSKDGGDRIYFNGSNIAVEDAGAQYGTNGSENSPETAGSAADRQQENTKALLRLAESIENAAGCGIIGITKYSDSQPRDDHGRWTDGGGGDSGGASGGTSPLKDSGYEYKKITDDAIKNVPRVNIFDDDEMNTRYQQANKDLLKEAQKHPVGTEVSIVYGADMKPIKDHSYRVGEIDGEVKIDNPDQPYHAFHNHPSGNTFSPDDMLRFSERDNMLSLSAIGNNGQLFCISRTEKSDSNAYYSFLSSKFAEERFMGGRFSYLDIKAFNMMEFPDGIRKPLMEEVVSFCNECISGGEQYGFKYINS